MTVASLVPMRDARIAAEATITSSRFSRNIERPGLRPGSIAVGRLLQLHQSLGVCASLIIPLDGECCKHYMNVK